jgi:hypothetical protein
LQYVELRSLRLVGDNHGAIVAIQGDAKNILIEDCELVGGAIGISIQGMDGRTGSIRIRRNIIRDQRAQESGGQPVSHSQGIYASADTNTVIEENVLWNNGQRNDKCHGMYLVHTANSYRVVRNNWVGNPGSACIQARGGNFIIVGNVCFWYNTGIGGGHSMAVDNTDPSKTVYTNAEIAYNLVADPRELNAPAKWAFMYMLGADIVFDSNISYGSPRPWMSSIDQGLHTPIGTVIRTNNQIHPETSGIQWQPIVDVLLSRKSGVWGERFETGGVIDRSKR